MVSVNKNIKDKELKKVLKKSQMFSKKEIENIFEKRNINL